MILTCDQMRRSEEALFATGVEAEPLMDRAGLGVADVVSQFFPQPGRARVYAGKGHNGGDALVAARHLVERGWFVELHFVEGDDNLSPLTAKKLEEFRETRRREGMKTPRHGESDLVCLDGMLGIGAKGPLRGRYVECAREMNRLREKAHATTVAVDIPTGLDGDTGEAGADAVVADVTATMAHVKPGLIAEGAADWAGRLAVVPLDEIEPVEFDGSRRLLEPRFLRPLLPRRPFSMHKAMAGRVGVIAGSRGLTGAAQLCAQGALRAGAGLVTLYALESVYPIIAAAAAPEIMVKPVTDFTQILGDRLDALAIGPGLGLERAGEIVELIRSDPRPLVVDADALNALAAAGAGTVLGECAGPRLLTPHPGEMERLWPGKPAARDRAAAEFAQRYPVTLLWKGARTLIAARNQPVAYNSTGHPGMATGGVGDVLTGICAALLGQGMTCFDAACLGSWLSGRSAEIAVSHGGQSMESLAAGDALRHLGEAFTGLKRGCY